MYTLPESQSATETYIPDNGNTTKKLIVSALALAISASSAMAGYTKKDDYHVSQKVIPVVLKRGDQVEYGRLEYTGWVHKHEQQTGSSSKPLKGDLIDDRECNWQISGHMTRKYYVTSLYGQEDGQAAATVHLPIEMNGQSNGLASIFDHDPCSDYRGRINQMVAAAERTVGAQFDDVMMADLEKFKTELEGVTIIVNPES